MVEKLMTALVTLGLVGAATLCCQDSSVQAGDVQTVEASAPAAKKAGPDSNLASTTLPVEGMTCGGCALSVKVATKKLDGVESVDVSLKPPQAVVTYDPSKLTEQQIVDAINATGYKASLPKAKG